MTSLEPVTTGQRAWLTPTLVAIAIVGLVATAASFAWSMRENWRTAPGTGSEYIEPDPQVLNALVAPEGFKEVRDVPAYVTTEVSRCYLVELSRLEVLAAVEPWIHGAEGPE